MPSPTQRSGQAAERWAESWLCAQGLRPLARNVRWRGGEIDLVLRDAATVVFVEVRQRSRADWGGAAASITYAKRQRVVRTAHWWLRREYLDSAWPSCRFDVVAIDGSDLQWLRDAFGG
jgi:putative endonuclease